MWFNTYDKDGNLVTDRVRREQIFLHEESLRIQRFLAEVKEKLDIDYDCVADFKKVVLRLEEVRREDPDIALDAERLLNWAAAIDADIFRHLKYIENADLPIDRDLYFG